MCIYIQFNTINIKMNQEYVASLERIVHAAKINLIKADTHIKQLTNNQKTIQKKINTLEQEKNKLQSMYEYEKEKYLCNICFTEPKDCILEPCRHFVACRRCCYKLDKCPVCRAPIETYVSLFIV